MSPEKLASVLSRTEEDKRIRLTFYGLLRWARDKHGEKALYENVLTSEAVVHGYAESAIHYRDDMPATVVNAGTYLKGLLKSIGNMDDCLRILSGMARPYVIYVLFAGAGQAELVEKFRKEFEEHMRRYPSTLDNLPERYRKLGAENTNADTRQG